MGPTSGWLRDADGNPVGDDGAGLLNSRGMLRSGRVRGARDDIRPDWHPNQRSIDTDVEGHAAAILRRPGAPKQANLVVNNKPCETSLPFRGCDELLPGMLPAGTLLTVFVKSDGVTRPYKIYRGTGEGIAPRDS